VRFSHTDEHPFALTRRPVKMGDYRVSPGRLETHEVENLGGLRTEFLRVVLKGIPLGLQNLHFRGNKAFDLGKSGITREFDSPRISIQRVILAGKEESREFSSTRPVLLIAFSPALILTASANKLHSGDVYWLDANQVARIEKMDDAAAHLLAITFMPSPPSPDKAH
jgi:hypothetical protein